MNICDLKFHHLGLAVRKKEKALNFVRTIGYDIGPEIYDDKQKVNLIYCKSTEMPDIEIISKAQEPGPLDAILKNHDQLFYHVCFSTSDRDLVIKTFKNKGSRVIVVSAPKPASLFNGKEVSFYFVDGFGLLEIIQE